jgi:hypothetical protein
LYHAHYGKKFGSRPSTLISGWFLSAVAGVKGRAGARTPPSYSDLTPLSPL